jgi:hypothetical protein
MFHLQSQWSPETHLLPVRSAWETSARKSSVSFCDRLLTRTIFCTLIFLSQFHELWSYTLREWCDATLFIVKRQFAWISPSVSWRRSSEIKDGLPLLSSSWTSDLPLENSQHYFVTFCRFITLAQTATICLWISAGPSTFALRNRMTVRTSHLAGFWIVAAISNSITQTKPVLPLLNEHDSQAKDQGRRQCYHNKHKKYPYRPTRDASLLSGHPSYIKSYYATCRLFSLIIFMVKLSLREKFRNIYVKEFGPLPSL